MIITEFEIETDDNLTLVDITIKVNDYHDTPPILDRLPEDCCPADFELDYEIVSFNYSDCEDLDSDLIGFTTIDEYLEDNDKLTALVLAKCEQGEYNTPNLNNKFYRNTRIRG